MNIDNDLWFDALDYFGDKNRALRWFKAPLVALGGKTPANCISSDGDDQRIRELLNRLKHGQTA